MKKNIIVGLSLSLLSVVLSCGSVFGITINYSDEDLSYSEQKTDQEQVLDFEIENISNVPAKNNGMPETIKKEIDNLVNSENFTDDTLESYFEDFDITNIYRYWWQNKNLDYVHQNPNFNQLTDNQKCLLSVRNSYKFLKNYLNYPEQLDKTDYNDYWKWLNK